MELNLDEIEVNGKKYVLKEKVTTLNLATSVNGLPYVMVRTYSAGVFAGYLKKRDGKEVQLLNARRIWYWAGAASLSQLATDGTSNPDACKFPCEVPSVELTEAIEILPITEKAEKSIKGVKVWKQ